VSYPLQNLSASYPVVESVSTPNGVGGANTTQYSYGNMIFDTASKGRGNLGFQWTQTKDVSTGLVSRTYYRQDFPYIGMVAKAGKGTSEASWSNLSLTTNEYKFMSFAANDATFSSPTVCQDDAATGKTSSTCPASAIQPGRRYVPYAYKTVSKAWDWNDQTNVFIALPQTRTTTTLSNLGNATEIFVETLQANGAATGYTKKTTSEYSSPDFSTWNLGRLLRSKVETTAP